MKKKDNILCVFTRVLGGKTFSNILERHIELTYTNVKYVDYDAEIFQNYHPPFYLLVSDALQSAWRIKRKFKDTIAPEEVHDAIYFQSYHLTPPFAKFIKNKFTVLSLDSTPLSSMRHNLQAKAVIPYSHLKALSTYMLSKMIFKPIFEDINLFLARTELVKHSLVHDYNIPENKVIVTYLPVDTIQKNVSNNDSDRLQLLFVGNDWHRKGGEFLLEIFDDACAEVANLTIISTDPKVKGLKMRPGIKIINGLPRSDIMLLMKQSDIFLFPSWRDELGLVLCEAVSQGVAVLARKSGAQDELVLDDINGRLFDFSSTPEEWRASILEMANDTDKLITYKQNSLVLAKKMLDPTNFASTLSLAFSVND